MIDPLGAIFGAGVALRNALYDRQILKRRKLLRPVVSIGNLSVGGSGKTPFVIALGTLLKERCFRRAFSRVWPQVKRGCGGRSGGNSRTVWR